LTLASVRARCQQKLRDTDLRRNWFSPVDYDQAITEEFIDVSGQLPTPYLLTASAFTIAAGLDTFTLPLTHEYGGDLRFQKQSDLRFLTERTVEEIDALRAGDIEGHVDVPTQFCLWEEADKTVQGRCWPRSRATETIDMFASIMADDLRAVDMDAVSVDLSLLASAALVNLVCAALLDSVPAEQASARNFNSKAAAGWRSAAGRMLWKDAARRHNLMSAGAVQRWVP
jgi:hypothetical protein